MVAFFAQIGGFTGSPSVHVMIPFDIVVLNIGNAYNENTGEFTAPVAGVYSISYEVQADGSCGTDVMWIRLYLNGGTVASSASEYGGSGGTAVTLQLAAGDVVWVAISSVSSCVYTHDGNTNANKFSGHLLYQII